MKKIVGLLLAAALTAGSCTQKTEESATIAPPHLEKRGSVTQLIVQGQPWLVLGCELGNSTSSCRDYLTPYWPQLKESGVNTVLAVVSWEQTEPQEGAFDFSVVDNLIADARANGMKLALLWFGSWK
ncbi:MAG: beta-galactosidase, partial [Prevotella sp.]|nr:beta-galactosidase [Prevotella sp.]